MQHAKLNHRSIRPKPRSEDNLENHDTDLKSSNENQRETRWIKKTSGDEEWLRFVEVDATNRAIMLIETVEESAHAIVPELDHTTVQTRQYPWPFAMKAQPFHPIALRLELRQHPRISLKFLPHSAIDLWLGLQLGSGAKNGDLLGRDRERPRDLGSGRDRRR